MKNTEPLIVVINDDERLAKSWSDIVAGYVSAAAGCKPEVVVVSGKQAFENRKHIWEQIQSCLLGMVKDGRKPDLIITDNGIDGRGVFCGGDVEARIRGETFFDGQKKLWPEGKNIPIAVISGGPDFDEGGGRMMRFNSAKSLFISNSALYALGDGAETEEVAYLLEKITAFINRALGISSPGQSSAL